MKKNLLILFIFVLAAYITKAQVTVYGGPTNTYTSLNAAFAAINAGTHFGAITIDVTASTIEGTTGYLPTPLLASGQSAANYSSIIIRPTAQATISGAPASGRGVIELDGADNVTIDGDIVGGPVNRDLQIENANANNITLTAVIRLIGRTTLGLGSNNNTIQNCVIRGNTEGNNGISGSTVNSSFGIYAGTAALSISNTGLGDNYDDLTIKNNEFNKCYSALYIRSNTANTSDNCLISSNVIGSNTVGETITYAGIDLSGLTTSTVTLNDVFNFTPNTTISPYAIQIGGTGSNSIIIVRNKVHQINSLNITSGYGAYGINLAGGNNHSVINNVVYDISGVNYSSTSTTYNGFGIRVTSGTGHSIYYNSVNLFGLINLSTGSASSMGSSAFIVTSTAVTGLTVKNNIFCNTQTSTLTTVTTRKYMAVWFPTSYNFANATLDNNAYNVTNDADHFIGKTGTTNNTNEASNLFAWQAFSQVNNTSNDVNSVPLVNAAAPFVSNTNLNIPTNTNYGGESGAVIISSLGTNIDYNANVRPLTGTNPNLNPDMGAYEFDGLNGFATDAGVNDLASPASTGCYSSNENVIVTLKNYGLNSISNIPVTVIIAGPITQTLTGTYSGPIAPSATFDYTIGSINMSAAGVYTIDGFTSLPGDMQALNDPMSTQTRTVVGVVSLPQVVDFTGFTGSNLPTFFPNWAEATGASVPNGTTSSWTSQTNFATSGNVNARLYLYGTSNNEWIVGPKVLATANTNISFDAGITANTASTFLPDNMGSDDVVRVMVSNDCGASFTAIYTISATNSLTPAFTNFNVSLGAYAGQNIIVAFLGQDGTIDDTEAYYFQLDNINLYNASPTDAGVASIISPSTGCFTNNEPVVVDVTNYGTASITNFPVEVWISGPVTQTLTSTYTGILAPSSTASFTIGTINMSTAGTYTLKSFTSLSGDINNLNDTSLTTKTTLTISNLPQYVNFTGFTGSNLPTFFPEWTEGIGATAPSGTTSAWASQTNFVTTGNVNARLYLYGTTNNEWIVSPKVLATANTNISFDAGITGNTTAAFISDAMGSDDMVRVMVSTDCGNSFTPIYTISATNSLTPAFTNFNISLSAYAGQEIIVGFLGQDGTVDDTEAYYFQLDNINLYNASPTDAGVASVISPSAGCFSNAEPIVLDIKNYGIAPITNFLVDVWVSGPVTQTFSTLYTGTLVPNANASFSVGILNMSTAGTYSLKAFTSLIGDLNNINDSAYVTKTTLPLGNIPQFVSFTGFTGSNLNTVFPDWREGKGVATPDGTISNWTYQNGFPTSSNVNARLYLYGTVNNEWLVGPKVLATASTQIAFDAGITGNTTSSFIPDAMGSDDMVRVMVSTDCGTSFTPIFTISATNSLSPSFTNFNISLASYAGQEIIVAFLGEDGVIDDTEAYYFQLDNINLYNNSGTDGGVSAILTPTVDACLSTTETIVVTVNNYGLGSLTNFPVTAIISGPINSTITSNYTGTLLPSTSDTFTIGVANMNLSGTYTIEAGTNVFGDPNSFNDNTSIITTQSPDFGISGTNLICSSGSVTLSVVGSASTYTWSNASNSNSIVVSPTVNTTYTAVGTGTNNCNVSAYFTVTVTNPTITGLGSAVCGSTTVGTLTANAFAPVSWYATPTSTVVLATGNTFTTTAPITTTYYAEAVSSSNGSLQTQFTGGNSCTGGNMFDITATNGAIVIDSLDINTTVSATSTLSVILYYKIGTYLGSETTPGAWTAWDTVVVTSAGLNQPSRFVHNPLNIPNNQLYAIFVNFSASYSNGSNAYSNSDLTLQTGAGLCSQFGGVNASRMFNGNVYYTKPGCISPKIPVTLTVNPTPTLSLNSSTTTICSGNTVTLSASGSDTYTWSTSSTNTNIVVSPSVTTSYSVSGYSNLCSTTETALVNIMVNQTPTVTLTSGTSTICQGNGSITIVGSPTGGVYSGASITGSLLSIASAGTFNPVYSFTNTLTGCSNSDSTTVIVSNCTGFNSLTGNTSTISIYPNPSNGNFVIETNTNSEKIIEITDMTGRVVLREKSESESIKVNLIEFTTGLYQIRIKSENELYTLKVIKQ